MRLSAGKSAAVAAAILLVQAGAYYTVAAKQVIPRVGPWIEFPTTLGYWTASDEVPVDDAVLAELKPDDYLNRDYAAPDRRGLNFFIGYFNSRRDGRAPHSPEWCLPGAGWESLSSTVIHIDVPGVGSVPANEYIVQKSDQRSMVIYWYYQGQKPIASEVGAQLYAIPDMMLHGRTDTSLVRIITPIVGNDTEGAKNAAFDFARAAVPLIQDHIR